METQLRIIRTYFKLLSFVSTDLTAKQAFKTFQKIRIKQIRKREKVFYQEAKHYKLAYPGHEDLDVYEFGNPRGKIAFLVHGWESNAGCLYRFAKELAEQNYRVIALNLPAHAFYKKGATNLLECKLAMRHLIDHINPQASFDTISHSFGSAVIANALANSDYKVDRMVFLTNPNKVHNIFRQYQEIVQLPEKPFQKLLLRVNTLLGDDMSTMDVEQVLQNVNFDQLLMLHDEHDKILPYSNSVEINEAIQSAELITFKKVGHYRMLWNDEVVNTAVNFIFNRRPSSSQPA